MAISNHLKHSAHLLLSTPIHNSTYLGNKNKQKMEREEGNSEDESHKLHRSYPIQKHKKTNVRQHTKEKVKTNTMRMMTDRQKRHTHQHQLPIIVDDNDHDPQYDDVGNINKHKKKEKRIVAKVK